MKHCISIGAGFPLVYFDWSKIVWLFLNFLQDINKIIFHETEILCTLKWSSETMLRIAPFLCIYLFARNVYPPMLAFLRPKDTFLPLHDKPGVSVYTVPFVTSVFISWIKYCVVLYWLSLPLASASLSHICREVKGPEQGYLEAKCCVVLYVCLLPIFCPSFQKITAS